MELEIKTYQSLPCSEEKFFVNGIKACLEDFGEVDVEGIGGYRCKLLGFKAKMPTSEVLTKYDLSVDEYKELVEKLDDVFNYGYCRWCV